MKDTRISRVWFLCQSQGSLFSGIQPWCDSFMYMQFLGNLVKDYFWAGSKCNQLQGLPATRIPAFRWFASGYHTEIRFHP